MSADGTADAAKTIQIRVRYDECDPMNLAHHSRYPVWFEMGRTEWLRDRGISYRECEQRGIFFAVTALSLKYRRPAKYDDELELTTRRVAQGHVQVEHEYELRRGDELLATGTSIVVCLDRDGRPRPMPDVVAR